MTTVSYEALEPMTRNARELLEGEFAAQLEETFGILPDGGLVAPRHERDAFVRNRIIASIEHRKSGGMGAAEAVADYVREASFTFLNRFVALKMLEARNIVRESISRGEASDGYREFHLFAPDLPLMSNRAGYRLYLESVFDELSTEVRVLFSRRDPAAALWPRRRALDDLLALLNDAQLTTLWREDETIGWVYQFFNAEEERRAMRNTRRGGSSAPRNSRELAVRNQFFTPRYVVRFLVDNTLGRTWWQMRRGETALEERCEYLAFIPAEREQVRAGEANRAKKDPRDLRILDPACGSGHFLLYAFDLLLAIYEEAWADEESPAPTSAVERSERLNIAYPRIEELRANIPELILRHNLHGVDIDPRCAQIAALALWMRGQRAFTDLRVDRDTRAMVKKTNIVVAEPMPGERDLQREFLGSLPNELAIVAKRAFEAMELAGEAGTLLRIEEEIANAIRETARATGELFASQDQAHWVAMEKQLNGALERYATDAQNGKAWTRRLFADDAESGLAFIDVCRERYDVVLMNPPFGDFTKGTRDWAARKYPRTKNDIYAAFVERGVMMLHRRGMLGAITSRTGFFLSSYDKWREEVVLGLARPTVIADLGFGVLHKAMVEVAAYCLEAA